MTLEPRLNAYRPDLADARLKGRVEAARFVEGAVRRVVAASAPLKGAARADAGLDSEVLRGERFRVFDDGGEGWSWGQIETDSYVGFVPTDALGALAPEPSHRVSALRAFIYSGPDMKLPARAALSIGACVAVTGLAETRGASYGLLAGGEGAVFASHLVPVGAPPEPDFVAVAERFLNVPYLWGGRTSLGLDCSALVQVSLMAAGIGAARDTDLQEQLLGRLVIDLDRRRGDLLYWKGHVAIVAGPDRVIHASGHHMTVVAERLDQLVARIGPPRTVRRIGG